MDKPVFEAMEKRSRRAIPIVRAIQIDRYGGPEVLIRRELPVSSPGPDEVLIRLADSGVNFCFIWRPGRARTSYKPGRGVRERP
jgi:hypothetical protein